MKGLWKEVERLAIQRKRSVYDIRGVAKLLQAVKDSSIYELAVRKRLPAKNRIIIDCDAQPFLPKDWSIHSKDQIKSAVRGTIEFDLVMIAFHLDPAQKSSVIVGNDLRRKLEGKPVFTANVLDYLLANPSRIPESWKTDEQGRTRHIFFWGTIYRDSYGDLFVRCLCWQSGEWSWDCYWLVDDFDVRDPAAVSAS